MRILHDAMVIPWKPLTEPVIVQKQYGKWFGRRTWENPDTKEEEIFTIIGQPDWVVILARLSTGEFVLTEEFNQGVNGIRFGLPGGVLNDSEDPHKGVQRELLEETGIRLLTNPKYLGTSEPIMRNSPLHYHMFFGEAAYVGMQSCDPNEHIRVHAVTQLELITQVTSGGITSSSSRDCILTAKLQNCF